MNAKSIVSGVLLFFVAASVVYLVVSESRSQSEAGRGGEGDSPAHTERAETAAAPSDVTEEGKDKVHVLTAYYFHRTKRCQTCMAIEAYAEEALRDAFPEALESGELQWRVVNVEDPGNEHFVEDYELISSALVLVDTLDGQQNEWRKLGKVWDLVDDELKFKAYVEAEALPFLEGGP